MAEDKIPGEVRGFIAEYIDSVEQLEVLLLLWKDATRNWSTEAVSEELRTSVMSAAKRLQDLADHGLLLRQDRAGHKEYRFEPKKSHHQRVVGQLAEAYSKWKYQVIDLIFSRPIDQLRVLANTFKFRKDDDDTE